MYCTSEIDLPFNAHSLAFTNWYLIDSSFSAYQCVRISFTKQDIGQNQTKTLSVLAIYNTIKLDLLSGSCLGSWVLLVNIIITK